ncbi:hypothetical protein ACFSCZ_11205 [Siminovitchia sediminis]|uniref:Uncharacterized protein n=1 Tax=Siminovitchia sediminis TaxID=1274353 RepID=A0ABW4KIH1_9BACI
MQTREKADKEYIDGWILEKLLEGKTVEEIEGTAFLMGNELFILKTSTVGSLDIEPLRVKEIVMIQSQEQQVSSNICDKCGLEHSSFKDLLQCCEDID